MTNIVVTCHRDGSVETLLKDKVLDTRKFGERTIERVTEIRHNDCFQHFYIYWLKGPYAQQVHSYEMSRDILGRFPRPEADIFLEAGAQFQTYEDAVAHEIECVNAMRLSGVSFA